MLLPPTVLVVAAPGDLSADLVVRELDNRGTDVHRINPADLVKPGVLRLTGYADEDPLRFIISDEHRTTPSASIVSVFWWHPDAPEGWAQGESRAVLEGLLYGLEGVVWVNHPLKSAAAKPGPGQLKQAAMLGFRTPRTIYTNDPMEAVAFADEHGGQAVCKTLTGHSERFVPARIVTAEEIEADADAVRRAVHYFQQPVEKVHDIRLTVIGERLFPCKVTSRGGSLDWRAVPEEDLRFEPVRMSQGLIKKVERLMLQLGLEYAAFDFAVDASGTWWFLEANPSGQFGFVQAATGMALSRAIAEHLYESAMASRVFTPDGGHRASSSGKKRKNGAN
ncbi:hypothetical protein ABZ725_41910 [Streptomyces sp. NPDC006872]|uniref:hypothetical protein n=1 Tax=Streptomyces sp. NPDC006872 TaxID=3155720 RepID=UPI0034107EEA